MRSGSEYLRSDRLVTRKYRQYFLSTLAMTGSSAIASIVDRIMVGNLLGAQAFSASSLVAPYIYIINTVYALFIHGGNTMAVTSRGRCDSKTADRYFTISLLLGGSAMAVLGLLCIALCAPVSSMFCAGKPELYDLVYAYFQPQFCFGFFVILTNGFAAFMRVDNMRRLSSAVPIAANVVNLLCDYLFMGVLKLGIGSAAWATNIGYASTLLLLIPYLRSDKRSMHFVRLGLKDLKLMLEAFRTGLATALTHFCTFLKNWVMNLVILSALGAAGIQVVGVCLSAQSLAMIFFNGAGQTMMPIAGGLYGEKDYSGLRYLFRTGLLIMEGICLAILCVFMIFPDQIAWVFNVRDPQVLVLLRPGFRMYSLCLPFIGALHILRSHYQSTAHRMVATLLTVLEGVVFFIPVIWILGQLLPNYVWLAFTISPALSLACVILIMHRLSRKKNETGFLMIPQEREAQVHEFSIQNRMEDAEGVTHRVYEVCSEAGLTPQESMLLAIAAEELCTNIVKYAYGTHSESIDIMLKLYETETVLKIRDDGEPFDPTSPGLELNDELTGIPLLKQLPFSILYNRVIGFNSTIITLPREL